MQRHFRKFYRSEFFWQPLLASVVLLVIVHTSIVFYRFIKTHTVSNATFNSTSTVPEGVTPASAVLFTDTLGQGWSDRSLHAEVQIVNGQIQVRYLEPWAGFSLHSDYFNTEKLLSLSFALFVPANMAANDAYVVSANLNGSLNPKQSIAWYLPNKEFRKGVWQQVLIPLTNLDAADTKISGISFLSETPGTIVFDNIAFVNEPVSIPASPVE